MFGHIVSGEHYTLRIVCMENHETQNGVNRYYKEENKGLDRAFVLLIAARKSSFRGNLL